MQFKHDSIADIIPSTYKNEPKHRWLVDLKYLKKPKNFKKESQFQDKYYQKEKKKVIRSGSVWPQEKRCL